MPPLLIERFVGPMGFLSNFYVEPDGTTVEHEFQAAKTLDADDKAWIMSQPTPNLAKRAGSRRGLKGRKIVLRHGWEGVKIEVMHRLLVAKFNDHDELRKKLIATHPAVLVEGNHWHDTFWGICQGDCYSGPHRATGDNNLGRLLMAIRTELRD